MRTIFNFVTLALSTLSLNAVVACADVPEPPVSQGPIRVEIRKTPEGFGLFRGGEPYFVKGAGGSKYLDRLVAAGGNSIRTWHAGQLKLTLDDAKEHGLTVAAGLWLGHERHGFKYSDAQAVTKQKEEVRQAVLANQSHPALLLWGIGNEMEGDGHDPQIWQAVNDIAKMIKEIDPYHPTMTVIAGTGEDKIRQLRQFCPDIDVIGINMYGDLSGLPAALKKQELDRPYILTEFGPTGWWQVAKTPWGEEIEPTSTEKAKTYLDSYRAAVASQRRSCLGSYAFMWGSKQEHTRTWFGMFLPSGEPTGVVDAMQFAWTGSWPANRCPEIAKLDAGISGGPPPAPAGATQVYPPRTELACRADARDPEGGVLKVVWELRSASSDKRSGGDREEEPPAHPDAIVRADGLTATIRTPPAAGPYRVFVYVFDEKGNAATANLPILVKDKDKDSR